MGADMADRARLAQHRAPACSVHDAYVALKNKPSPPANIR
jgi:hypothetical protein